MHCLVTDGAYDEGIADVRFLPAATPIAERMQAVLAQVHEAIAPAAEGDDPGIDIDPALAVCVQLALAGPHLAPPPEPATRPPLTVSAFGMQLHAATTVDGRDRKQLERLCRYMLRPPFAHDAVEALEGGRVRVHFKAPWRSGAAHADMSPDKFLARLCGLVPPPGFHMTRYFGVFANRHHLRARIIPPAVVPAPEQQLTLRLAGAADDDDDDDDDAPPSRIGWAKLLARVFALDVTTCRKCGGRMRVLEVVDDPDHIAASSTAPGLHRDLILPPRSCCSPVDRAPSVSRLPPLGPSHRRREPPRTFFDPRTPVSPTSPFRGRAPASPRVRICGLSTPPVPDSSPKFLAGKA